MAIALKCRGSKRVTLHDNWHLGQSPSRSVTLEGHSENSILLCTSRMGESYELLYGTQRGWCSASDIDVLAYPSFFVINDTLDACVKARLQPDLTCEEGAVLLTSGTVICASRMNDHNWLHIRFVQEDGSLNSVDYWLLRRTISGIELALPEVPRLHRKHPSLPTGASLRKRSNPTFHTSTVVSMFDEQYILGARVIVQGKEWIWACDDGRSFLSLCTEDGGVSLLEPVSDLNRACQLVRLSKQLPDGSSLRIRTAPFITAAVLSLLRKDEYLLVGRNKSVSSNSGNGDRMEDAEEENEGKEEFGAGWVHIMTEPFLNAWCINAFNGIDALEMLPLPSAAASSFSTFSSTKSSSQESGDPPTPEVHLELTRAQITSPALKESSFREDDCENINTSWSSVASDVRAEVLGEEQKSDNNSSTKLPGNEAVSNSNNLNTSTHNISPEWEVVEKDDGIEESIVEASFVSVPSLADSNEDLKLSVVVEKSNFVEFDQPIVTSGKYVLPDDAYEYDATEVKYPSRAIGPASLSPKKATAANLTNPVSPSDGIAAMVRTYSERERPAMVDDVPTADPRTEMSFTDNNNEDLPIIAKGHYILPDGDEILDQEPSPGSTSAAKTPIRHREPKKVSAKSSTSKSKIADRSPEKSRNRTETTPSASRDHRNGGVSGRSAIRSRLKRAIQDKKQTGNVDPSVELWASSGDVKAGSTVGATHHDEVEIPINSTAVLTEEHSSKIAEVSTEDELGIEQLQEELSDSSEENHRRVTHNIEPPFLGIAVPSSSLPILKSPQSNEELTTSDDDEEVPAQAESAVDSLPHTNKLMEMERASSTPVDEVAYVELLTSVLLHEPLIDEPLLLSLDLTVGRAVRLQAEEDAVIQTELELEQLRGCSRYSDLTSQEEECLEYLGRISPHNTNQSLY